MKVKSAAVGTKSKMQAELKCTYTSESFQVFLVFMAFGYAMKGIAYPKSPPWPQYTVR